MYMYKCYSVKILFTVFILRGLKFRQIACTHVISWLPFSFPTKGKNSWTQRPQEFWMGSLFSTWWLWSDVSNVSAFTHVDLTVVISSDLLRLTTYCAWWVVIGAFLYPVPVPVSHIKFYQTEILTHVFSFFHL